MARAWAEVLLKDRYKSKAQEGASLAGGVLTAIAEYRQMPNSGLGQGYLKKIKSPEVRALGFCLFSLYFLQLLKYTWNKNPSLEYNVCFWTRH